jgi:DNA-directed RNA polymerase beta subunit
MTVSQLLCCILGKKALYSGEYKDCTPFTNENTGFVHELCNSLEKHGINKYGKEIMYSGYTGERIESEIFIGPTYYHKLKHMVSDKMYARGRGNMQELTRQPQGGRSQQGALRIGEMEKDALVGIGATSVLHDRMFLSSDVYTILICSKCKNVVKNKHVCTDCNEININKINLPFSCKLLFQQVQCMGIKMLFTEEKLM